jgi:hypothetical protein
MDDFDFDGTPPTRTKAYSKEGTLEFLLKYIVDFANIPHPTETEKTDFSEILNANVSETLWGLSAVTAVLDHYKLNKYLTKQGGSNRRSKHRKMKKSLIRRRR